MPNENKSGEYEFSIGDRLEELLEHASMHFIGNHELTIAYFNWLCALWSNLYKRQDLLNELTKIWKEKHKESQKIRKLKMLKIIKKLFNKFNKKEITFNKIIPEDIMFDGIAANPEDVRKLKDTCITLLNDSNRFVLVAFKDDIKGPAVAINNIPKYFILPLLQTILKTYTDLNGQLQSVAQAKKILNLE